jgi:hypothetical protein
MTSSNMVPLERRFPTGAALVTGSFLAFGCGGNVTGNGQADASSSSVDASKSLDAGQSTDVQAAFDAGCNAVIASDYDQSCVVDTDCVLVMGEVRGCPATACYCPEAAINKDARAQYMAAFAQAVASEPPGGPHCGCPCIGGALCRAGKCQAGSCGAPPTDTLPTCADAGGTCDYSANTTCNAIGPPDACAYSDEVCCLK